MTRTTNFGRKRTHVQAGFETAERPRASPSKDSDPASPQKESGNSSLEKQQPGACPQRSEQRRLRRIAERRASTVCFVCREPGHAAKACPKAQQQPVGLCYRCGSKGHTLSRCRRREDAADPLPHASCFVCSARGHLASACPRNAAHGIYPDGGSCRLCRATSHLARDCALRRRDQAGTAARAVFGTGAEAGADEDDFHVFKRRTAEVVAGGDERTQQRAKKVVYF